MVTSANLRIGIEPFKEKRNQSASIIAPPLINFRSDQPVSNWRPQEQVDH
jgi:hypothetical protein